MSKTSVTSFRSMLNMSYTVNCSGRDACVVTIMHFFFFFLCRKKVTVSVLQAKHNSFIWKDKDSLCFFVKYVTLLQLHFCISLFHHCISLAV